MNKFKRPQEYPTVSQPSPVEKVFNPPEPFKLGEWECIGCAEKATLLHRGTAYCRRCYDKRNYEGSLIG